MKLNRYESIFIALIFIFTVSFVCSFIIPSSGQTVAENPQTKLTHFSIDINEATKEQFAGLEGIDMSTAQRIIEYRNELGRFKRIEDLLAVDGVDYAVLYDNESFITIKK